MISFTGFLMSFTKITGFAFYVFFLFAYMIIDVYINKNKKSFFKQFMNWWSWKKVFLWLFPVLCFMVLFKYGDYFTSQSFYGTFVSTSIYENRPTIYGENANNKLIMEACKFVISRYIFFISQ